MKEKKGLWTSQLRRKVGQVSYKYVWNVTDLSDLLSQNTMKINREINGVRLKVLSMQNVLYVVCTFDIDVMCLKRMSWNILFSKCSLNIISIVFK